MATLYLVGLGLRDEKTLSLEALEILKNSSTVFFEDYTNFIKKDTFFKLEALLEKKLIHLTREEVENEKIILHALKNGDCSLIVPGEALIATTHHSLVLDAIKQNHKIKVIHSSSIVCAAISLSGLHVYKFGKICTIPFWKENYSPTSFLDTLKENKKIKAHSLCLLDLDENSNPMSIKKALEIIFLAQKKRKYKLFNQSTKIIILSKVSWKDQIIWAGQIKDLKHNISGPAVIIFPAKMHFLEEEYFNLLKGLYSNQSSNENNAV